MSRRCDREGVPWASIPRDFWQWTSQPPHHSPHWGAHPDPLQRRVAHRRELLQPDDDHCAHLCTATEVLQHLRERPVLP